MKFILKHENIELCKLLKLQNLAQSGGEAKFFISEGRVKVNNELELRKRRKIIAGDSIEFEGTVIEVEPSA
ncbi:MAG: RNA-binding S4 domain-containing protein [Kiritimatiellae bacterium]|nr:RNA-binding S4 domain-containing protein [Kiritimatiellia bacterium]